MDIRVGISACLLGEPVRFDGGHKRDAFLVDGLGAHVEWVPVCPEVSAGMGIPRPAIRLVGRRAVDPRTGADWTARLERASDRLLAGAGGLSGFVLKNRSPSCGMERVRVYPPGGTAPSRTGVGVFARALRARFPLLPIEEEGRLRDPLLRESFLHAVFAYARWQQTCVGGGVRRGALVDFHTRNKYLLLAHDPARYRDLGRLVAGARRLGPRELADSYARGFMHAVRSPAPVRRHVNVLQHIAGHVREHIGRDERAELAEAIEDYRAELVPRSVPLALLRHHARRHRVAYIERQSYLEPAPKRLRSGAVLS